MWFLSFSIDMIACGTCVLLTHIGGCVRVRECVDIEERMIKTLICSGKIGIRLIQGQKYYSKDRSR